MLREIMNSNFFYLKESYLSVNSWKLYKANSSREGHKEPTATNASSVTFVHCSFKTFRCGQPWATDSTPLLWITSESSDKVSRYVQCIPTASNETSVILAQAAIPNAFNDFPQPWANATKPVSVNPSQKRRFTSSSCLQNSPTAATPWSPT